MAEETLAFQAEVAKLLDIVARSLYSEKDVFLRELVSNASDACDKLRHEALTEPGLSEGDPSFRIVLSPDRPTRSLTVEDNGIGMTRDELVENLGTIARSGTSAFLDRLSGDARKDVGLIGQFGVGFYSAFMVADEVEVFTRRAGESQGWRWHSDGRGGFTVGESDEAPARGTRIVVHLAEQETEFLEASRLRGAVKRYSDHIGFPIELDEGKGKAETLNAASALWTRSKGEVGEEQYAEFYRHVGHGFDSPWLTVHGRAEGRLEYSYLLFVPSQRPFDLFDPARRGHVKLYVRRVYISDQVEGLLPSWLRFLRGVVDSEDLPLNISRETLQANPLVERIRGALVRKVLGELKRKAEEDREGFATFWDNFGAVLKEGLYESPEFRDEILTLARFRSTGAEGQVSLADYLGRMREGQEAIYTIAGDDPDALARSPQIEGFRARGIEVLLLSDPIDEFWMPAVGEHEGKPFRSVTQGGGEIETMALLDEEAAKREAEEPQGPVDALIALLRLELGDEVKDVRRSARLTDSAVCLVAAEGDMDMHLERLLRQHQRVATRAARILEVNPRHRVIAGLAAAVKQEGSAAVLKDAAHLLLDQARILEGEALPDPAAFSRRLASVMERALG